MCEMRFTFSPRHLGLLAHTREVLEAVGCVCHVEVTTMNGEQSYIFVGSMCMLVTSQAKWKQPELMTQRPQSIS